MNREATPRAKTLLEACRAHHCQLAVAESCTGGMLAAAITAIPGASDCFSLGIVAYHNNAKQAYLGVSAATLRQHGAVSVPCATEMVNGLYQRCYDLVRGHDAVLAVAVTGIAGPGGASADKKLGLVHIAARCRDTQRIETYQFSGGRHRVRAGATLSALDLALETLVAAMRKP